MHSLHCGKITVEDCLRLS